MARNKKFNDLNEVINLVYKKIEKEGKDFLKIRSLSKALNISPMTLYNYADNINDIVSGLVCKGYEMMHNKILEIL